MHAGALTAFVFVVLLASGHVAWQRSDAPLFEGVARSPFGDGSHLTNNPKIFGVAYRFGRILYPLLAWTLALGRPQLIRTALAVIFVLGVTVFAAAAAEIARRAGRRPALGACVFAAPFTLCWFGTGVLVSEPVVMALVLLAFLAYADGHSRRSRALAAVALLAREIALVPLLALAITTARRRGLHAAVREWWWVPLPYAAWAIYVRLRIGAFPFTDPAASRSQATSLPFAGIVKAWTAPWGDTRLSVVIGVATLVVAVAVLVRYRVHSTIALAAALSTASVVCFGPFVWAWLGECARVLLPTHSLIALVIVTRGRELAAQSPLAAQSTAAPPATASLS